MVCEPLHIRCIQFEDADDLKYQKNEAREHGGWEQALPDERYASSEYMSYQKSTGYDGKLYDAVP